MKAFSPPMIKAILHARAMKITGQALFDQLWDFLVEEDEHLVESVLAWVSLNLGLDISDVTYPGRGVLISVLSTLMSYLVWDRFAEAESTLNHFSKMLSDLKLEHFPVRPQTNLFQLQDLVSNVLDFLPIQESPEPTYIQYQPPITDLDYRNTVAGWLAEEHTVLVTDNEYMSHALVVYTKSDLSLAAIRDDIVGVLQEMKKVSKKAFTRPHFRRAIKDIGLTSVIETICKPTFLLSNRDTNLLHLEHVYRVGDQLAEILDNWTPTFISRSWNTLPGVNVSNSQGGAKTITSAKEFLDIFDTNSAFVPGVENISYCFFLTSFENFLYNYNRWLGNFLENQDYNIKEFNDVDVLQDFYSQVIWLIRHWCTDRQRTKDGVEVYAIDVKQFANPRWEVIVKKTGWLRGLAKRSEERAKALTHCTTCVGLPTSHRCCQYSYMPHITNGLSDEAKLQRLAVLREELTGSGVTMVPPDLQIKPNVSKDEEHKRHQYSSATYHPHSIGKTDPFALKGLEPDSDIVEHCGHQLLLVLDQKRPLKPSEVEWKTVRDKNVIDVVWWGALDQEMLAILQDNIVASTGVQAVKRGDQFRTFGAGKMVPLGSQMPSGGRAGDAYTSYSGMDGSTANGLEILFNQAATSVILHSMAKLVHKTLAKDMRDLTVECDRLGMTGANIFNCTGYMAPIHSDRDATRGLCVQALLHADSRYREFSFCNIEYQYYIATSSNCLWSFDSRNLHGTMLPSKETVQNLNSHAIDPNRAVSSNDSETSNVSSLGAQERPRRRPQRQVIAGAPVRQSHRRLAGANQEGPRVAVSNGAHVAVPHRNRAHAAENARRRGQYEERSNVWRRD
ncbi:hypothetical protein C8R42DRAFT_719787 [Lentinula raphanica]|nr:hypothetical protein C8R42DRAFT_719787 [Lentinula raphanica]